MKDFYIPVLVFLIVLLMLYAFNPSLYWDFAEPLITFVTLFVAILFTFIQSRKRWEDSLPKFMNVKFVAANNPDVVGMEEESVYLSGESDIRVWDQSTGQELNLGDKLYFDKT